MQVHYDEGIANHIGPEPCAGSREDVGEASDGQRFVVLKVRRVAGVETLSLRHHDLGSFAIAREWTDWAPPGAPAVSAGKSLTIDAFGLLSLTKLVTSLTRNGGLDR